MAYQLTDHFAYFVVQTLEATSPILKKTYDHTDGHLKMILHNYLIAYALSFHQILRNSPSHLSDLDFPEPELSKHDAIKALVDPLLNHENTDQDNAISMIGIDCLYSLTDQIFYEMKECRNYVILPVPANKP